MRVNGTLSKPDEELMQLAEREESDLDRASALLTDCEDRAVVDDRSASSPTLPPESNDDFDKLNDDFDKLLSDEIEKLSFAEREQVVFDVHGISQRHHDDPEDIERILAELEQEIRKIRNRKDYEKAKYLNEDFVNDRDFRLLFLRCDLFDTKVAAQRLVKHFEVRNEMFGEKCLARHLRMNDLSADDMHSLESGIFSVLPTRDVAGRTVVVYDHSFKPEGVDPRSVMKAIWYIFDVLFRDVSHQKQGIVVIAMRSKQVSPPINLQGMTQFARCRAGVPRKIAVLHYCYDNPALRPFIASLRIFIRRDTRNRFFTHYGDHQSLMFKLQTYGIPTEYLFSETKDSFTDNLESHRAWINTVRAKEASGSSLQDDVMIPRRFDVLFGRKRNTREHTGNMRALHLCEMVRPQYEMAGKFEKTAMAERIVNSIRDSHGRFLKWEDDGWVEVDAETAREKISHFFRHYRSKTANETPNSSNKKNNSSNSVYKNKRGMSLEPDERRSKVPPRRGSKQSRSAMPEQHLGIAGAL